MKFDCLPNEIILKIIGYTNVITLSKVSTINKKLHVLLHHNRYNIIDTFEDNYNVLPQNIQTYYNYKFIIDYPILISNKKNKSRFSETILEELIDNNIISINLVLEQLSERLIRKYYTLFTQNILALKIILPIDILEKLINKFADINWQMIWENQHLNLKFVLKYIDFINWRSLSNNEYTIKNNIDILKQFYDRVIWPIITQYSIAEEIIEYFIDKIDAFSWINISINTKLSEGFIKRHVLKLDIVRILRCQKLNENFIEWLLNRDSLISDDIELCWSEISNKQKLSKNFIIKYKNNLHLNLLIRNKNIKRQFLYKIYGNEFKNN